jgi:CDP-6-deoxy-D-xylo-4-hexulose-3-dehydrase
MKYELAVSSWDEQEIQAIQEVLKKNRTTMGEAVEQYEKEFAKFVGSKYCVMVNSGSSANLLAVAALFYKKNKPLKQGDEVIVPAVSWPTTYYPLYQYGLKIKFVDIDLDTLNYDLDKLEEAVTDKTKIIVVVNLLGNPNDFDRINEIIQNKDIFLLEDNCESLGAEYNSRQAGTWGIMGTFSSFFSHHISTMEGGMIVSNDEEIFQILLCLRAHGWTRNLPAENLISSCKSDDQFNELYRFILPGYNFRPIEMMGAIGSIQLKKLPDFLLFRRRNACYFKELFANNQYFRIQKGLGRPSWFGFSIILNPLSGNRKQLIDYLTKRDIDVRPIVAGNFTKNEVVSFFDYEIFGEMKNADYLDKNGFFVGNHHFDIRNRLDYFKEVLHDYFRGGGGVNWIICTYESKFKSEVLFYFGNAAFRLGRRICL